MILVAGEYAGEVIAAIALTYAFYELLTYQGAKMARGTPGELSALMNTGPITGFFYS